MLIILIVISLIGFFISEKKAYDKAYLKYENEQKFKAEEIAYDKYMLEKYSFYIKTSKMVCFDFDCKSYLTLSPGSSPYLDNKIIKDGFNKKRIDTLIKNKTPIEIGYKIVILEDYSSLFVNKYLFSSVAEDLIRNIRNTKIKLNEQDLFIIKYKKIAFKIRENFLKNILVGIDASFRQEKGKKNYSIDKKILKSLKRYIKNDKTYFNKDINRKIDKAVKYRKNKLGHL